MISDELLRRVRVNASTSALMGLALVGLYHYDPPGTLGALIAIRLAATINIMIAIMGLFVLMRGYRLKEKK